MKLGITVNVGEYNSLRFDTSDHDGAYGCNEELVAMLKEWTQFPKVVWWLNILETKLGLEITKLPASPVPKQHDLLSGTERAQSTVNNRKPVVTRVKPNGEEEAVENLDLTGITIVKETPKAFLVTKSGLQRWIAKCWVEGDYDPGYFGELELKSAGKWILKKNEWKPFEVR